MGLLDGILGNILGGQQASNSLLQMALGLLQQRGGMSGLVEQFRSRGFGQQADSWVSTGANLPITGSQIEQALGNNAIGDMAAKLGLGQTEVSSRLAELLPNLVDRLTPNGAIPENQQDLISQAMSLFTNRGPNL